MVPVITPDFLGLMILIKIDSSSLFLKIFYVSIKMFMYKLELSVGSPGQLHF